MNKPKPGFKDLYLHILFILFIGGIGVQTFTSCSDDEGNNPPLSLQQDTSSSSVDGDSSSSGGSSSSSGGGGSSPSGGGSSSSDGTSSSSTEADPLACATVPASGYATISITPPTLTCGNGKTASGINWLGSPTINWNNPKDGTYSNISVMANCGTATNLMASCPGTLTVQPMISCSMAHTGYEGTAITQPVLACSDDSEPFGIVFSGYQPNWNNPTPGSYGVFAEADCGQGTLPKISCGTLTVNPVTLTCGSVPASGYEGIEITPPVLTCSHGTRGVPAWANAPDWSDPAPSAYSNISATANCGLATKTADCNGTLTVNPATLTCSSVPASGFFGIAITPPALTCNNGKAATNIAWANAPGWSNPAHITSYSDISATANCGTATKTANCNGTLNVSCSGKNNTSTQYCSNGIMKEYGAVTHGGQTYKTVVIGGKTWMAENLNYNPGGTGSACYSNNSSNCLKYGRLYDWSTARSVCPTGWHLPSDAEWTALENAVGGTSTAGTKLKSATGWNTGNSYIPGTDNYGFSALPGGDGFSGGNFSSVSDFGRWWSATEDGSSSSSALHRIMAYFSIYVSRFGYDKSGFLSVRCVSN